jgi:hypothetical protein
MGVLDGAPGESRFASISLLRVPQFKPKARRVRREERAAADRAGAGQYE